ncbi:putative LPS assembly protein LptD [Polaribacter sp. HL-MS24]|uniref:putative LPS assembly protein LptD n=1 Tax=Polaribacter sp. HL-MS24 TaxID=3077735 RepID=UPI00293520B6|nr:putative LPS assembly protein LptD [Polaribacter sp. HL-MS24]WOC39829.1 putative LPS assembly protein LptD [Polaribacter sp. HL-MS24]
MQSNRSYILLFFSLFLYQIGHAQKVQEQKERDISSIRIDTAKTIQRNTSLDIKNDTLFTKKADTSRIDSIKPKETIEDIITHDAKDYTIQNAKDKTLTLYNEAVLIYGEIDLKAGLIVVDYEKETLFAKGILDSTGYSQRPYFKQGSEETEQDSLLYNFKSKRALIYGLKTKQGEMFTYGKKTKRVNDSTIYVRNIRFTTSDKKEKPDYYITTDKAKLIPGKKIIVGTSNLVIADIPTPLFLPFAYFPLGEKSVSGFLIPALDTGSSNRGIGLQNGGYYFAINDYADLALRGDVYSNGSWGLRALSNYNLKYRFSGSFNLSFENNIQGIRGFDTYNKASNFNVRWSHSQDAKASPNSRFTASVNVGSSRFFRESLNEFNTSQFLTNTFNSSISYSKTFVGTPFNLSTSATHSQNTNNQSVNMTFPSVNLTMSKIFPFEGKGGVKKNPFQKMGFDYAMQGEYRISTTEDEFFTAAMFKSARSGVKHRTGTSTNIKVLKHFTLSPNISYQETWNFKYLQKTYNQDTQEVITDTISGFKSFREYNTGVSLSFARYGTFKFKKGRLKAIRHTVRPSISYNYTPDFADKYNQQVQQSEDPLDLGVYSPFDNNVGLYGKPNAGLSNAIGITLNNVVEAKVAPKDPESDEEDKKISILNNLNFSSSYNIAADSLRWSNVSMSAGTRLFNDKMAVNFNASLNPYQLNDDGNRIDKFNASIFRLERANLTANYSLSSADFKKEEDSKKGDKKGNGAQVTPDLLGEGMNPSNRFSQTGVNRGDPKKEDVQANLYKASIPWTINLAYSAAYANNGITPGEIKSHSIMFSGNLELSPKWKVGYSSGYDVKGGAFTFSRFNFARDLDSWQFNFNWVPFGNISSYTFFIGVKSTVLQDLKWDKNKPPDRRLF